MAKRKTRRADGHARKAEWGAPYVSIAEQKTNEPGQFRAKPYLRRRDALLPESDETLAQELISFAGTVPSSMRESVFDTITDEFWRTKGFPLAPYEEFEVVDPKVRNKRRRIQSLARKKMNAERYSWLFEAKDEELADSVIAYIDDHVDSATPSPMALYLSRRAFHYFWPRDLQFPDKDSPEGRKIARVRSMVEKNIEKRLLEREAARLPELVGAYRRWATKNGISMATPTNIDSFVLSNRVAIGRTTRNLFERLVQKGT